jgi:hypothetical protein
VVFLVVIDKFEDHIFEEIPQSNEDQVSAYTIHLSISSAEGAGRS